MLTWEPWKPPKIAGKLVPNQPRYRLARIAAGKFDRYLHRYARQVKAYGGPLILRPFHEMDGFWYPWGGTANGNTPLDFVRAWRHVHRIFDHRPENVPGGQVARNARPGSAPIRAFQ